MHGPPGSMGPVVPGVIVLVVAVDGMVAELDIVVLRAPDEVGSEVASMLTSLYSYGPRVTQQTRRD